MDDPFPPIDAQGAALPGLLQLDQVAAPLALCDTGGRQLACTDAARDLLARCGADASGLPDGLWRALAAVPCGEAVTWRPEGTSICLGCTRYAVGTTQMLVLMREVSGKQRELSQRMQQQRLEATGSLVAAIAHDIRGALATVIFNADVLATRGVEMDRETLGTFLGEIMGGAERLKEIVDGLLDFARLRVQVQPAIALDPVLQRCAALLRPKFRDRGAELTITHAEPEPRVRGNPLIIEQIVQSLLQNALEAGAHHICVHSEPQDDGRVRLRVHDDGPGVVADLHERIFEPFFTTKSTSTGLGLATSREAARHVGGDLLIDPAEYGASLSLFLPGGGAST
jgi:signal transduction histidine kinase